MSGDIGLFIDPVRLVADLGTFENDLATDDGLRTAFLISIFTDRFDDETRQGGWWADQFNDVADDRIGSRLWKLARAKATAANLALAESYVRESLDWAVEDKVVASLDVAVTVPNVRGSTNLPLLNSMLITIGAHRPDGSVTSFRSASAWAAEVAR